MSNNRNYDNTPQPNSIIRFAKNSAGKTGVMKIYVSDDKLRFSVYTGMEEDKKDGKQVPISMTFDKGSLTDVLGVLVHMEELVQTKTEPFKFEFSRTIKAKDNLFEPAKFLLGMNKENVFFVAMTSKKHQNVPFPLAPTQSFNVYSVEHGEKMTPKETSKMMALGFIQQLKMMIASLFTSPNTKSSDGDKGNNNRYNGGGNDSNDTSSEDFDF